MTTEQLHSNNDYDADLMETKEAKYIINYMTNFKPQLVDFLNINDSLFPFLFPFVSTLFEYKKDKITSGFSISEANSESLKEIINLLESECESIKFDSDKLEKNLDKFDLDKNIFIDTDSM